MTLSDRPGTAISSGNGTEGCRSPSSSAPRWPNSNQAAHAINDPTHPDAATGTHRRRLRNADAGPASHGRQRDSLSRGVRGSLQPAAVPRPHQAHRHRRPTHHLLRARPRLHTARLHRTRLPLRSEPRPGLGRGRPAPTPTACSSTAAPTTPCITKGLLQTKVTDTGRLAYSDGTGPPEVNLAHHPEELLAELFEDDKQDKLDDS